MSKRSKPRALHTSLRLHPDVSDRLALAAGQTGWSTARVVGHLVNIGFAVLNGDHKPLSEHLATFQGAKRIHAVELDNARRLAEARKALRTPGSSREPRKVTGFTGKRKPAASLPAVSPAKPDSAA